MLLYMWGLEQFGPLGMIPAFIIVVGMVGGVVEWSRAILGDDLDEPDGLFARAGEED